MKDTSRLSIQDCQFAVDHPLRILIVDGDPLSRSILNLILNNLGYTPATAESGSEFQQAMARTSR